MPNGLPIEKETFHALKTPEAKMDALFDVLVYMNNSDFECAEDRKTYRMGCDERFINLEKRKWINTAASAGGGMIGGFLAIITALKFKLFG